MHVFAFFKKRCFARFFLFLALSISFITGCSYNSKVPTGSAGKNSSISIIRVPVQMLPTTLNPFSSKQASNLANFIAEEILPQTFYVDNTNRFTIDSWLLSEAEVVGLAPETIVYKIRPGANWSNGQQITEADFNAQWQFCVKALKGQLPGYSCPQAYSDVLSVEPGASPETVKVILTSPLINWEVLFNDILPLTQIGYANLSNFMMPGVKADYLSGGPYKLTSYSSKEISLDSTEPKAAISRIRFDLNDSSFQSIENAIAFNFFQVAFFLPTGPNDINVAEPVKKYVNLRAVETDSILNLVMNPNNIALENPYLREALSYLIDRNQLAADTVGLINPKQTEQNNHFLLHSSEFYTDNSGGYYQRNLFLADSMLAKAGYSQNSSGQVTQNNNILTLTLSYDSSDWYAEVAAKEIADQLREFGIVINLVPFTNLSSFEANLNSSFELALVATKASTSIANIAPYFGINNLGLQMQKLTLPPASSVPATTQPTQPTPTSNIGSPTNAALDFESPFSSDLEAYPFNPTIYFNLQGEGSQVATSYYLNAITELFQPKSQAYLSQADSYLWTQMIELPLFDEPIVVLYSTHLKNFDPAFYSSGPFYGLPQWYLTPFKFRNKA